MSEVSIHHHRDLGHYRVHIIVYTLTTCSKLGEVEEIAAKMNIYLLNKRKFALYILNVAPQVVIVLFLVQAILKLQNCLKL